MTAVYWIAGIAAAGLIAGYALACAVCARIEAISQEEKCEAENAAEWLRPAFADETRIFHTPFSDIGGQ